MLIRKQQDLKFADVTPRSVYLNRRKFLYGAGIAGAAALLGQRIWRMASPGDIFAGTSYPHLVKSRFSTTEKPNSFEDVTHYNNF